MHFNIIENSQKYVHWVRAHSCRYDISIIHSLDSNLADKMSESEF